MKSQNDWPQSKTHTGEKEILFLTLPCKDGREVPFHKHNLHLDATTAGTPEDELMTQGYTLLDVLVCGCTCLFKNMYILVQE